MLHGEAQTPKKQLRNRLEKCGFMFYSIQSSLSSRQVKEVTYCCSLNKMESIHLIYLDKACIAIN